MKQRTAEEKNMFNFFKKIPQFFSEVKSELLKVAWPNRKDLIGTTWVVIVTTALMTAFIGAIDYVLSQGVARLLQ